MVHTHTATSPTCSAACNVRPIAASSKSPISRRYRPTLGVPSAFVGTPVFDGGRPIAVLILQLSADAIDRVMTGDEQWARDGLGKTGETYLVGPDMTDAFELALPDRITQRVRRASAQDQDVRGRDSTDPAAQVDNPESEAAQLRCGTSASRGTKAPG